MKMLKVVLSSALVLGLSACAKSGDGNKASSAPKEGSVTDLSVCQGPVPAGASIYGRWKEKQASNGVTIDIVWQFSEGELVKTHTCNFPNGPSVSATAKAPVTITNNEVVIEGEDDQTEEAWNEDRTEQFSCEASIGQAKGTFSFKGPCLAFDAGLVLVP